MSWCKTEPMDDVRSRCIYCGATFKTHGRVFAECQRIDLSAPLPPRQPENYRLAMIGAYPQAQPEPCGGCQRRKQMLNDLVPGSGDAVAKVAEPARAWWLRLWGMVRKCFASDASR